MTRRIRITISYDGTNFHGWQVQPGMTTIQGVLEAILQEIEGAPVHVQGSGRTDAGVHALAQVAAFDLQNPIPVDNLQRVMNRLLPPSIRIHRTEAVHADFQPRFDAKAKTYRYTIFRAEICPPFQWPYLFHHPYPLDEAKMMEAAKVFEGEHDFSVFAAKHGRFQLSGPQVRTVFRSELERTGDLLAYTVCGSGFLKYMVRNIVGTLIEVGRGNLDPGSLSKKSGATAPARGLTLVSVEYDNERASAPLLQL